MSGGRILHLTSVHEAGDTRIFVKECRSLSDAGFHVELIGTGSAPPARGAVEVRCLARRGRLGRWLVTLPAVAIAALTRPADIYHLHDPELLPLGLLLRLLGKRVVYDVHEDVPRQIMDKAWLPVGLRPVMAWLADATERVASSALSGFVAATPTIGARFPRERTIVVRNYPRLDELEGIAATPFAGRPPEVLYIGAVSRTRGACEVVAGFGRVPPSLGATLVVAGPCAPPTLAAELARSAGNRPVQLLGRRTRAEVRALLSRARVGMVTLLPTRSYRESLPVKLFEYMASGIPVVASDFPAWREIVQESRCGLLVDPTDAAEVGDAMSWLLSHPDEAEQMGRRGAAAVRSQYQWSTQAAVLVDFYRRLLGGAAEPGE
jgi:glycosyltransferase involved in cell wall biosynthesis